MSYVKNEKVIYLSREKHLDHMVRVVPFIVLCYFIQSYVVFQISPGEFTSTSLTILGGLLAFMVSGFVVYDIKHQVEFSESQLTISFLGKRKTILFSEIVQLEIAEPGQSFSHLIVKTADTKHTFYFIDNAEKIKCWIEERNISYSEAA